MLNDVGPGGSKLKSITKPQESNKVHPTPQKKDEDDDWNLLEGGEGEEDNSGYPALNNRNDSGRPL